MSMSLKSKIAPKKKDESSTKSETSGISLIRKHSAVERKKVEFGINDADDALEGMRSTLKGITENFSPLMLAKKEAERRIEEEKDRLNSNKEYVEMRQFVRAPENEAARKAYIYLHGIGEFEKQVKMLEVSETRLRVERDNLGQVEAKLVVDRLLHKDSYAARDNLDKIAKFGLDGCLDTVYGEVKKDLKKHFLGEFYEDPRAFIMALEERMEDDKKEIDAELKGAKGLKRLASLDHEVHQYLNKTKHASSRTMLIRLAHEAASSGLGSKAGPVSIAPGVMVSASDISGKTMKQQLQTVMDTAASVDTKAVSDEVRKLATKATDMAVCERALDIINKTGNIHRGIAYIEGLSDEDVKDEGIKVRPKTVEEAYKDLIRNIDRIDRSDLGYKRKLREINAQSVLITAAVAGKFGIDEERVKWIEEIKEHMTLRAKDLKLEVNETDVSKFLKLDSKLSRSAKDWVLGEVDISNAATPSTLRQRRAYHFNGNDYLWYKQMLMEESMRIIQQKPKEKGKSNPGTFFTLS